MRFLFFSDSHGMHNLPDAEADALFLLGDIEHYELRQIDKKYSCPKFGILGNHDNFDFFDGTDIVNLHHRVIRFNGLTIGGFQGCPVYKKKSFGQHSEEEVYSFVSNIPQVDLFIAHANPMVIYNSDETNPHRGFLSFKEYIDKSHPRYFVHGHVHESKTQKIGDTTLISVYPQYILDIT